MHISWLLPWMLSLSRSPAAWKKVHSMQFWAASLKSKEKRLLYFSSLPWLIGDYVLLWVPITMHSYKHVRKYTSYNCYPSKESPLSHRLLPFSRITSLWPCLAWQDLPRIFVSDMVVSYLYRVFKNTLHMKEFCHIAFSSPLHLWFSTDYSQISAAPCRIFVGPFRGGVL